MQLSAKLYRLGLWLKLQKYRKVRAASDVMAIVARSAIQLSG